MNDISQLWQRIEDWYERQGAAQLLHVAASEDEILVVEQELGFRLPADLRDSLARHNGSAPHGWPYGQLLSLVQILQKKCELDEENINAADDEVEYTEAERAELAKLAEDVLLPVEECDGTTLLEISVVDGIGVKADESCSAMDDILTDIVDELQLGNHHYVQRGDFVGLVTTKQLRQLESGTALKDVLKGEDEDMDEQLNDYLRELLNDLDALSEDYSELGDTETRERMTEAMVLAFLRPQVGYTLPADLGLFSDEGNAAVRAALEKYIARAGARAQTIGLNTPAERLAAFQAPVYTDEGNCGDEYFGWLDDLDG